MDSPKYIVDMLTFLVENCTYWWTKSARCLHSLNSQLV